MQKHVAFVDPDAKPDIRNVPVSDRNCLWVFLSTRVFVSPKVSDVDMRRPTVTSGSSLASQNQLDKRISLTLTRSTWYTEDRASSKCSIKHLSSTAKDWVSDEESEIEIWKLFFLPKIRTAAEVGNIY